MTVLFYRIPHTPAYVLITRESQGKTNLRGETIAKKKKKIVIAKTVFRSRSKRYRYIYRKLKARAKCGDSLVSTKTVHNSLICRTFSLLLLLQRKEQISQQSVLLLVLGCNTVTGKKYGDTCLWPVLYPRKLTTLRSNLILCYVRTRETHLKEEERDLLTDSLVQLL